MKLKLTDNDVIKLIKLSKKRWETEKLKLFLMMEA